MTHHRAGDADRPDGPEPEVGTLAEEATRLWSTLSDWSRDRGAEAGHGATHRLDDHLATGAAECTVCPLCRTVHAVRNLDPEVRAHLSTAFSSLVQAASTLLSTQPPAAEDPAEHDSDEDAGPDA